MKTFTINKIYFVLLFVFSIVIYSADNEKFFLGILLIDNNSKLTVSEKKIYYNKLKDITGVGFEEFKKWSDKFLNNPEKLTSFLDKCMSLLNNQGLKRE